MLPDSFGLNYRLVRPASVSKEGDGQACFDGRHGCDGCCLCDIFVVNQRHCPLHFRTRTVQYSLKICLILTFLSNFVPLEKRNGSFAMLIVWIFRDTKRLSRTTRFTHPTRSISFLVRSLIVFS